MKKSLYITPIPSLAFKTFFDFFENLFIDMIFEREFYLELGR